MPYEVVPSEMPGISETLAVGQGVSSPPVVNARERRALTVEVHDLVGLWVVAHVRRLWFGDLHGRVLLQVVQAQVGLVPRQPRVVRPSGASSSGSG